MQYSTYDIMEALPTEYHTHGVQILWHGVSYSAKSIAHQVAWSSLVAEVCGTQSNAFPLEAWAGRFLAVNGELAYNSLYTGKSRKQRLRKTNAYRCIYRASSFRLELFFDMWE